MNMEHKQFINVFGIVKKNVESIYECVELCEFSLQHWYVNVNSVVK